MPWRSSGRRFAGRSGPGKGVTQAENGCSKDQCQRDGEEGEGDYGPASAHRASIGVFHPDPAPSAARGDGHPSSLNNSRTTTRVLRHRDVDPPHRIWRCHRARRSVGAVSAGQDPRLLWVAYRPAVALAQPTRFTETDRATISKLPVSSQLMLKCRKMLRRCSKVVPGYLHSVRVRSTNGEPSHSQRQNPPNRARSSTWGPRIRAPKSESRGFV